MLGMLMLLPVVQRWQRLRLDLVGMVGFPTAFYSDAVLAELRRRVQWADRSLLGSGGTRPQPAEAAAAGSEGAGPEPKVFDSSCSICLEPLLTGGHARLARVAVALPLCLHAFHKECIYQVPQFTSSASAARCLWGALMLTSC